MRPYIKTNRFVVFSILNGVVALLLLVIFLDQKSQTMTPRPTIVPVTPPASSAPTPEPTPRQETFPKNSYFTGEGKVWLDNTELNSQLGYNLFTLHFTLRDSPQEYSYPIQLPGIYDWVSDPLIAYGANYGCVTLQASGYLGFYVFNIKSGQAIDRGPQYSECLDWIDTERVLIIEQPYGSNKVTYYLLNAATKQKQVFSSFNEADIPVNLDK